jgi:hypothetical protein
MALWLKGKGKTGGTHTQHPPKTPNTHMRHDRYRDVTALHRAERGKQILKPDKVSDQIKTKNLTDKIVKVEDKL